ncbi:hypothetical protein NE237_019553 [Protea cynaroides]|uniref:Cupin type-1 domain-containing protein n=1 Tax=Protea cynaroides TaxID=273540 RepID=A0A9Q0K321_9MAGN|nr:hypothetical protein NE237_019553 [Protea cynaroides]
MVLELGPTIAQKVFEGEGGSYYSWSSAELPILGQAKVGGGKLVLQPLGLALAHYSDSSKIGIVVEGKGRVGFIFPNASEEKVVEFEEGDLIAVPFGSVSWWLNSGGFKLMIVFLGDTSKASIPGTFTYFYLAGSNSIFTGFSTEFVSRACDLNEDETNKVVKSQSGVLIIKLKEVANMPQPSKADRQQLIYNIEAALPDVNVRNGGQAAVVSSSRFPFLEEVGLCANYVRLYANAMCAPHYVSDSAVQVIYIVKGSGYVQVVGVGGERVLDTTVKAGYLFVVPSFFVVSTIAGDEGMEWFSVTKTKRPCFNYLVGHASVWNALSPEIIQASLNLTPDEAEVFNSKMSKNSIIIPAPM